MARDRWRLPGYRVEELLGGGATSEVWRATVSATGAPVALKKIRLTDQVQAAAAVSEAAVLSALDHPNLIRLHRLERLDAAVVLVLDYASAGSLSGLLGARGRLTPGEVASALTPIGAALAHAHAAGVVHGDVTPANVLFTDFGLPLLADLGMARLVGDPKPVHTTMPYADPLVVAGYLPDAASDVYMLGAVTLQTVTGHLPPAAAGELDENAWAAKLAALLARSHVPAPMAAVIARAMSLAPASRGTAAEFALDLGHSATPVALEVSAGRTRVEPSLSRLAAIAAGRPAGAGAAPGEPTYDPPAAPPLTVGVRLPSPMPTSARHRLRARIVAPRAALVAGGVLVAAALACVAVVCWPSGGAAEPPTARAPAAPSTRAPSSSGAAPSASVAPGPPDVSDLRTILAGLDAARAAAFAARDPQRLTRVYLSAVLLARDRALLASLVPPGCGLDGVHTEYSDLQIAAADTSSVSLTVTAQVERSKLVCAGAAAGSAAATTAARLAMTLRRVEGRWRVDSLHPAAG